MNKLSHQKHYNVLILKSLIVLLFASYLNAQNSSEIKLRYPKLRYLVSNWQIHQLKDSGALIVRLRSNQKLLQILKEKNQLQTIKQIQNETNTHNKIIMQSFKKHYNFSPVYFMYDFSTNELIKNPKAKVFLNDNLEIDTTIYLKESFYLYADIFSPVIESTLPLLPDSLAINASESGPANKTAAILIKNKYNLQLKHPFPYLINGYNILKFEKYVIKLNQKFFKFLDKNPKEHYPSQIKPYLY
ncbi:MAG: hypothetical protein KatS3mg027_0966 [Bacteroidia bacterium]|nr:MAG: hypothetical protein KatS3mg027_0966 [Bacteroidia bacterium]